MKIIAPLLLAFSLSSCAPLIIGGAAGYLVERHEANWHARCMRYYGNPDCIVGHGAHRGWIQMPMGVHR